jgi:hypothetical protein
MILIIISKLQQRYSSRAADGQQPSGGGRCKEAGKSLFSLPLLSGAARAAYDDW